MTGKLSVAGNAPGRRFVGRAPGRLDLMGSVVSYTGNLALTTTIQEAVWAAVDLREDNNIVFVNPQVEEIGWQGCVEFPLAGLSSDERVRDLANRSPGTRWTAYVLGAFFLLKEWFPDRVTHGANVYITSEIPIGGGAGASSALAAAVLKSAAHAYGLALAGVDLASACQWMESMIAESAGRMADPIAAALGEIGCLLPVVCQPCEPQPPARLPEGLELWRVDTGRQSGAALKSAREAARAATFMVYKIICDWEGLQVGNDARSQIPRFADARWNGYLANVQPSLFRSNYEPRLPESMTGAAYLESGRNHVDRFTALRPETAYRVRACGRFAVEENHRAKLFLELARAGAGFEMMGELMYQSHLGHTECGLGSEDTDLIVSLVCEEGAGGLYGAKTCGPGVAAVLGRKDAEASLWRVVNRYAEMRGVEPKVSRGSSMGADKFGVLEIASQDLGVRSSGVGS